MLNYSKGKLSKELSKEQDNYKLFNNPVKYQLQRNNFLKFSSVAARLPGNELLQFWKNKQTTTRVSYNMEMI